MRALVIPCLFVVYRWTAHPNTAGRPVPERTNHTTVRLARFSTCVRSCAFSSLRENKEPLESSRGVAAVRTNFLKRGRALKSDGYYGMSCVSLSSNMIRRTKFKRHFGEMHKTFLYSRRIVFSFYSIFYFFYFFFSLRRFSYIEKKDEKDTPTFSRSEF